MKRNLCMALLALLLAMPLAAAAQGGDVFEAISGDAFTFSSGVGGWSTEIVVSESGDFVGHFYDSDMGDTGDDHPQGTRYECHFSGTFAAAGAVDPYTQELRLVALDIESDTGAECVIDGVRVVYTGPYGIEGGETFLLYGPGRETADLPEAFVQWVRMPNGWDELPDALPFYGLYNVEAGTGFFSTARDDGA